MIFLALHMSTTHNWRSCSCSFLFGTVCSIKSERIERTLEKFSCGQGHRKSEESYDIVVHGGMMTQTFPEINKEQKKNYLLLFLFLSFKMNQCLSSMQFQIWCGMLL